MKMRNVVVSGLVLASGLLLPAAYATEDAAAVADAHQQMAASYQAKAAEQDALIAEHEQMKKDYEKRFTPPNASKVGVPSDVKEMEAHCDRIINAAEKEKQELLDFAKWHEMRAAELQGK